MRSVVVLAGGAASGQALLVLASPFLTRLYAPADFGVLAVYVSVLTLLVVVASWRYELAIPLARDEETAANATMLSLAIVFLMSIGSAALVWLAGGHISRWTNTPVLEPYLWLLPLSLWGAGSYQALNYWAVRKAAFGHLARTKFMQGLCQVLTQLGLGLLKAGPIGLLLGDVIGRTGGTGTLATLAWRQDRAFLRSVSFRNMWKAAKRFKRFPMYSGSSALLNKSGLQIPALLLAAFYGPATAGLFALGQQMIWIPMGLIAQSVGQVYFGEASRLVGEEPAALRRLFFSTTRRLFLWGLLPIAILALGGPFLFELVFGEAWREAGTFARILALMYLVQFTVVPLSQSLNILERQDWQLIWDAGRLMLVVLGMLSAFSLGWSAQGTVAAYGIAMALAYVALFALSRTAILGHLDDGEDD